MSAIHRHALETEPVNGWRTFVPWGPVCVDGDCSYCRAGIPLEITKEWRSGVVRVD